MISNFFSDSLDFKSWLVLFVVFLIFVEMIKNKNPSKFPPGPLSLPFLGTVFTEMDFKTMNKLTKIYGDVFSLRVGSEKMVIISGYKMVKEALITQTDVFVDRPIIPLFSKVFKGLGTILSNGYPWKMHRKFAVSHLRMFGEGQKNLELRIQQESVYLCDAFKAEKGPFNPMVTLYNVCPRLFDFIPGPPQTIFENYSQITDFLRNEVIKHKEDWDPLNPRDFIDTYLAEMDKKSSDPAAGFNIESLVVSCLDLVEAGTESNTTTLRWGLLCMIKYPEIQEKVQAEIDRVIGQSRQACFDDRHNMPYTNAVVHEVQRFGDVVPLGFPKKATKDTTLGPFFIPKGTAITTNLSSVLHDPNEWETPHTFNPGHFLDENGQFRKRDAFMPFSIGRRACLGEQLARQELFLYFTSLLQRFTFTKCPGEEISLEGEIWFTYAPVQFRTCVSSR